jgi:hypothetical protein
VSDSKVLSVDEMLAADDVQYDEIEAWSGTVRIRSLSAGDMIEWVESQNSPSAKTAGLSLIVKSLVDANGVRIGRPEHLELFKAKDARITGRIVQAILALNGLGIAKVADAVKNAEGEAASAASPTVLP